MRFVSAYVLYLYSSIDSWMKSFYILLQWGKTPPMYVLGMTLKHQMVRLHSQNFVEYEVLFRYHYSQVHFYSKRKYLLRSHLWFE